MSLTSRWADSGRDGGRSLANRRRCRSGAAAGRVPLPLGCRRPRRMHPNARRAQRASIQSSDLLLPILRTGSSVQPCRSPFGLGRGPTTRQRTTRPLWTCVKTSVSRNRNPATRAAMAAGPPPLPPPPPQAAAPVSTSRPRAADGGTDPLPQYLAAQMAEPGTRVWVAQREGRAAPESLICCQPRGDALWVWGARTLAAARGYGLGALLLVGLAWAEGGVRGTKPADAVGCRCPAAAGGPAFLSCAAFR